MSGAEIVNLWGQQGLLILNTAGELYTHHLDGVGPALQPFRGIFQPLIVPTALKTLCADYIPLPANICMRANYLLNTLNLPWLVDCSVPNRDRWLKVEIEQDGSGYLLW